MNARQRKKYKKFKELQSVYGKLLFTIPQTWSEIRWSRNYYKEYIRGKKNEE